MRGHSKNGLFLMELMAVIVVFALCAAVCLSVFSRAKQTSQQSARLTGAVLAVQSQAECFKAGLDLPQTQYFSDDWGLPADAGVNRVEIDRDGDTALITAYDAGGALFSLTVGRLGGGAHED